MHLKKALYRVLLFMLVSSCSLGQADFAAVKPAHTSSKITAEVLENYQKAKNCYIKGDLKTALEILCLIDKKAPLFTPALELAGRIHFFTGNLPESEKYFLKAYENKPHNINYGKWLCRSYMAKGDLNKAGALLDLLLEDSPEDTSLLILNGKIMKENHNYPEAMEYFKKSFLIEDEIAEAHLDLAEIYASFSFRDKAADELEKALNILGEEHGLYNPVRAVYEKMR